MASIFYRIISGEIPAARIYEDEYTLAFLDIRPVAPGHTLVIPKIEVDHFSEVPEPYYTAIFQTVRYLAPILRETFATSRVALSIQGFEVPHTHVHLIPCESQEGALDFAHAVLADSDRLESDRQRIIEVISQHKSRK